MKDSDQEEEEERMNTEYYKLEHQTEEEPPQEPSRWVRKLTVMVLLLCFVSGIGLLFHPGTRGFPSCATAHGVEVSRHCAAATCDRWCGTIGFLCMPEGARPTVVCDKDGQYFELTGPCLNTCHT